MKKLHKFYYCAVFILITACHKEIPDSTNLVTEKAIGNRTNSQDIIPTYADPNAFIEAYSNLEEQLTASIRATYAQYPNGFTLYELEYTDLPNQVFETAMSPLSDFSKDQSYNSLWNKVHAENSEWLLRGADNFDTYPDNQYAISDIMKAMLNENGEMMIGDKLYHYLNASVDDRNQNIEVASIEMYGDIEEFHNELNNTSARKGLKLLKDKQWPPIDKNGHYHSFDPFDNLDLSCTTNRANWGTENYHDRKKYYWKNGFNYDIIGSHSFSNMEVWHKSRVLGWIHDVQTLSVPVQLKTLEKNCTDDVDQYSYYILWAPYLQNNANFWGDDKKIERDYLQAGHHVVSKSFYATHNLTWL